MLSNSTTQPYKVFFWSQLHVSSMKKYLLCLRIQTAWYHYLQLYNEELL